MKTIKLVNTKALIGDNWPKSIPDSGAINPDWRRVWPEYGAYLLTSVLKFTQTEEQHRVVEEVLTLCRSNNQDRQAWKNAAAKAALVAANSLGLNLDEESTAATLTALATAQAVITAKDIWALRAENASTLSIVQGWAAYAFGCSVDTVARIAGEMARNERSKVFADLLAANIGAMAA